MLEGWTAVDTGNVVPNNEHGKSVWRSGTLRKILFGTPTFYGIAGVLLLCFLTVFGIFIINEIQRRFWVLGLHEYSYYDSPLAVLLIICVVFCRRPRLLALSRWRPRWLDFVVGVCAGVLTPAIFWFILRDRGPSFFRLRVAHALGFGFAIVCLAPILEEILFRGIILRSLKGYLPSAAAVLLTALLASLAHPHFWSVLPSQLLLSTVYVAMGNSLPASITAHIANNLFALIVAIFAFPK